MKAGPLGTSVLRSRPSPRRPCCRSGTCSRRWSSTRLLRRVIVWPTGRVASRHRSGTTRFSAAGATAAGSRSSTTGCADRSIRRGAGQGEPGTRGDGPGNGQAPVGGGYFTPVRRRRQGGHGTVVGVRRDSPSAGSAARVSHRRTVPSSTEGATFGIDEQSRPGRLVPALHTHHAADLCVVADTRRGTDVSAAVVTHPLTTNYWRRKTFVDREIASAGHKAGCRIGLLKQARGVATRYDELAVRYEAAVSLSLIWQSL